MFKIRKVFKFEASHRLITSYSKECQNLHGHSYIVEVIISSFNLNKDNMVLDFKKLNTIVKPLINKWDHAIILCKDDKKFINFCKRNKMKYVLLDFNPTAEGMAYHVTNFLHNKLKNMDIENIKVRIHETDTGWAEYEKDFSYL